MGERGRSPAEIEADVARLQAAIQQARAATRTTREDETYHAAVAEVARVTRELVDYEARIPRFEAQYRVFAGVRAARRGGALLAAGAAALSLGVAFGAVYGAWLALFAPLFLAGLWTAAAARTGVGARSFRPRAGTAAYALAAAVAGLTAFGALSAWAVAAALGFTWAGLWLFGSLSADARTAPGRPS